MLSVLLLTPLAGCVDGDPEDLGIDEAELSDPGILATVPGIPAPAGYGTYCSITDPNTNRGTVLAVTSGDPCATLIASHPAATVKRAGLWSISGNNQALGRCDGGVTVHKLAAGTAALAAVTTGVPRGAANCVFTLAPTQLPAFGMPFPLANAFGITATSVFDFHERGGPWDNAPIGQPLHSSNSCHSDRTGLSLYQSIVPNSCLAVGALTWMNPYAAVEGAYDWSMPLDTPIFAVADGVVRKSYSRSVATYVAAGGCPQSLPGSEQLELFLETQVGTGQYAEHFVVAYHHMNAQPNFADPNILANLAKWNFQPMAPTGTVVKKGDVIGYIGSTGCSTGPHLDLSALRLTNLTGARSYVFATTLLGAGVNGIQGSFDPFGWAGPGGADRVDPMSFMFIGMGSPSAGVTDSGTFSINVWDPIPFAVLPHNGGASW